MEAVSALHVPQPHRRVEAGGGQDQVRVGVVGPGASRGPLQGVGSHMTFGLRMRGRQKVAQSRYGTEINSRKCKSLNSADVSSYERGASLDGVDLLVVRLEVVDAGVPAHAPHLERHVVRAGGQELALGVPLDGVDLVGVALEGLDGPGLAQPAHVDALVGAAGGEALVGLPVDVEGGRRVEGELLLVLPRRRVPDDRRPVHARALQGRVSHREVHKTICKTHDLQDPGRTWQYS